jgi:hypothetical protein
LKTNFSPFGGLSVEQVLANESGVPGFTFEYAAKTTSADQQFRWVEVPVFSGIEEMTAFLLADDPARNRLLFKRVLGTESPTRTQVDDLFAAQRRALMLRNTWQDYIGTGR